jgi:SAM-dependent methyltransferase
VYLQLFHGRRAQVTAGANPVPTPSALCWHKHAHAPTVRPPGTVPGVALYRRHLLPRLCDRACGAADLRSWRAAATAGLGGEVLEIGFGSGLNLEHYPAGVRTVLAVEPEPLARRLASARINAFHGGVRFVGVDAEDLALADASVDAALCTFTLCTIPDAQRALTELRRVLRPRGRVHFLEHGLALDPGVVVWQRRLEPLQRRLAGGCHLTRDPPALFADAGFAVEQVEQRYARGPRPLSWFSVGVAVRPG